MRGKALFTQYFSGLYPGEHTLHFNTNIQAGIYLLEISSEEYRKVLPLTIIQ
jgi:hypothetical protein